ncbi:MAG TPA: YebC/PmpR family DNA-binding transcriptional regulator [Planctomycetes bacterium]|nr:YebC/PmpR family DNA-binding transcriptional regulator [Planctomycetota bacterium]
MAGHSHSANIRFRKDRVDSARGKLFSKLAKEIISAAREGGGDPAANLRLRVAIDRARAASVPRDNIERAVKRGTGELQGEVLEDLLYEGYGPEGVAILVEAMTDNRNRTAPEVRKVFEKRGGNMGATGAVAWMFERKSLFILNRECCPDEDAMLEIVLEVGGEDLVTEAESYEVLGEASEFANILQGLEAKQLKCEEAKLAWIPKNTVEITDKEKAFQVLKLIDALEDLDDVTAVSANYEIPDEILEEHMGARG